MTIKEITNHYTNILNCPDLGIHPERTDDLKNEIKQLADIDHISYQLALEKNYSFFLAQYLNIDPDDDNLKKLDTSIKNLSLLRHLEGLDVTNGVFDYNDYKWNA